jgi:L-ribulose-5-phosphate 3-epimerase
VNRRQLIASLPALALAAQTRAAAAGKEDLERKARLRSAICAYTFREDLKSRKMTYDDVVHTAVELGVDGLDLTVYWFPDTEDSFLLPLRRLAYKNAVEIYSIAIRTEMCRPTAEEQAKEIAEVKKWVDVANKLGASHIRVFGGRVPEGRTEDEAAGWVAEILKRAGDYSGSKGVILGLENHGGITTKASRIIQIVEKVNSPWVGINLDTGNFESDAYQQMEACLPHTVNVQFKTHLRTERGKREAADWERIVRMFAGVGYKGYLALEYEDADMSQFPAYMKKLDQLARKYSG